MATPLCDPMCHVAMGCRHLLLHHADHRAARAADAVMVVGQQRMWLCGCVAVCGGRRVLEEDCV
jgi:hypothetical protein